MKELDEIVMVSEILNDTGAYDKIGKVLRVKMNNDSMIFQEIEEFIISKYKEMNDSDN